MYEASSDEITIEAMLTSSACQRLLMEKYIVEHVFHFLLASLLEFFAIIMELQFP